MLDRFCDRVLLRIGVFSRSHPWIGEYCDKVMYGALVIIVYEAVKHLFGK